MKETSAIIITTTTTTIIIGVIKMVTCCLGVKAHWQKSTLKTVC